MPTDEHSQWIAGDFGFQGTRGSVEKQLKEVFIADFLHFQGSPIIYLTDPEARTMKGFKIDVTVFLRRDASEDVSHEALLTNSEEEDDEIIPEFQATVGELKAEGIWDESPAVRSKAYEAEFRKTMMQAKPSTESDLK